MFLKSVTATVAALSVGTFLAMTAVTPGQAADLPEGYGGYGVGRYPATACPHIINGLAVSFGYGLCYQRELVPTPWGPRWRLVNHCC
jgi:hypothetical protein